MKKLKDSQIRGIEEARQRLAELEKKHAKALKELQRAEKIHVKTSRRRRTFHGYPNSGCEIINETVREVPESSSVTPDEPQDHKIPHEVSKLKVKTAGQGKRLGFVHDKWTSSKVIEPVDQAHDQSVGKVIVTTEDCRKITKDVSESCSIGVLTNTPHLLHPSVSELTEHDMKESGKNNEHCLVPDNMQGENKKGALVRNKEQRKRRKTHTEGTAPEVCAFSDSSTKKIAPNNGTSTDTHKTDSLLHVQNDERRTSADIPSAQQNNIIPMDGDTQGKGAVQKKTPQANGHVQINEEEFSERNIDVNVSTDSSGGFKVRHPDSGMDSLRECSSSQENSQKSFSGHSNKERWRYLFEEEFPRRSPRLRSKERHEIKVIGRQPLSIAGTQKSKPTRSSSPKENTNGPFPRLPVSLTKSGGPLSMIVDFSLPDSEFAKLKLDKIRGISNNVKARFQHSGQKFKIDSKRGDMPVQRLEAHNNNVSTRVTASSSNVESRNSVSQGCTEGKSDPDILEYSSKFAQLTHPQLLSRELVQEKVIESDPVFSDHPVELMDRQPLHAAGSDSQICSDHNQRHLSVNEANCGHERDAEGNPHDVEKKTLLEELPAESRCDRKCATKAPKTIMEPGCSGQNKQYTGDPSLVELQEGLQTASDVRQLSSRLPSDELSLADDENPPVSCNESKARPVKSLGHPSSFTTALGLSTDPAVNEEHQEIACPLLGEASCREGGESHAEYFPGQQPQQIEGTVDSSLLIRPTFAQKGTVSSEDALSQAKENTRVNNEIITPLLIQPGLQELAEDDSSRAVTALQHGSDTPVVDAVTKSLLQDSNDNLIKQQSGNKDADVSSVIQSCEKDKRKSANSGSLPKQTSQNEGQTSQPLIEAKMSEAFSEAEDLPGILKKKGSAAAAAATLVPDQSEGCETVVPVLMQACLEHVTKGSEDAVRSIALTTYECSSCHEMQVEKKEAVAVCQAHALVIWTAVPGQEWSVFHKWTLASGGSEEFCSVQFVSSSSHLILLTGGVFSTGNGRIYGCSEEAKYCMDLHIEQDVVTSHLSFAAMCTLNEHVESDVLKEEADVKLVLGAAGCTGTIITKWTLDSLCLIIKGTKSLPMVDTQERLSSLCVVAGSSCLLLGTAGEMVLLWNHQSNELLSSISCKSLGNLTCLTALTQMGLLFLTVFSCPSSESQSKKREKCSLLAVNPKTSKIVCLDDVTAKRECSFTAAAAWGEYVALGQQHGDASLWNITSNQSDVQLSISEDAVRSIGFHQHRPLVAFGSQTGCVHIFSLC